MKTVAGVSIYDVANIAVASVNTVIDPTDPLTDLPAPINNPNAITFSTSTTIPHVNDCPQPVNELLTREFPSWLQEAPNQLDAVKVLIELHLTYSGSDPATAQYFWQDPNNPNTALTPATGWVLIIRRSDKVTNASTQQYSQITSVQASEPVPTGFAQTLYESLAPLHFQGDLTLVEQECSDLLPPGSTFNTADGNPDWQAMNALVLSVQEDIDRGTTKVSFGPPAFLDLAEMEQLFRASLGILPSWKLIQRTTGALQAGSNVIGSQHMTDTHVVPPPSAPAKAAPWAVSIKLIGGTYVALVGPGTLQNSQKQGDTVTISNLAPTTINISQSAADFILSGSAGCLRPGGQCHGQFRKRGRHIRSDAGALGFQQKSLSGQ